VHFQQKINISQYSEVEDENVRRFRFIANPGTLTGEPPLEMEIHYSDTLISFIMICYIFLYICNNLIKFSFICLYYLFIYFTLLYFIFVFILFIYFILLFYVFKIPLLC
jgi:hypothetical protein